MAFNFLFGQKKWKNPLLMMTLLCSLLWMWHCEPKQYEPKETIKYFYEWDKQSQKGMNPVKTEDVPYAVDYFRVIYNRTGQVLLVESYINKKAHGFWSYYDETGQLVQLEYWNEGQRKQVIKYD